MDNVKLGEFTIRPRLNEIRKERGITQQTLSDLTGIPQGSISRFDSNTRHESAHIYAIMQALDVTFEELFVVTFR